MTEYQYIIEETYNPNSVDNKHPWNYRVIRIIADYSINDFKKTSIVISPHFISKPRAIDWLNAYKLKQLLLQNSNVD